MFKRIVIYVSFAILITLVVILSLVVAQDNSRTTAVQIVETASVETIGVTTSTTVPSAVAVAPSTTSTTSITTTTTTTVAPVTSPPYIASKTLKDRSYINLSKMYSKGALLLVNNVSMIFEKDPYELRDGVWTDGLKILQFEAALMQTEWLSYSSQIPAKFIEHYDYIAAAIDALVPLTDAAVFSATVGTSVEDANIAIGMIIEQMSIVADNIYWSSDTLSELPK